MQTDVIGGRRTYKCKALKLSQCRRPQHCHMQFNIPDVLTTHCAHHPHKQAIVAK